MDSKYCSGCRRNLPLSSFLAADGLGGRIFATCISCRNRSSRLSENPSSRGEIGKGESHVQKETGYRAIRARRNSESRTQTEAVEAEKETACVQKEQVEARREADKRAGKAREEQGRARRQAEKETARVEEEQDRAGRKAQRESEKQNARFEKEQERAQREARREAEKLAVRIEKEQDRARRESEKKTARIEKEQDRVRREAEKKTARVQEQQGRTQGEAENVARRDAQTKDLAVRNERLAHVQRNINDDGFSRDDGIGERDGYTTRVR